MKRFLFQIAICLFCLVCGPLLIVAAVLVFAGVAVALVGLIPLALWVDALSNEIKDARAIAKKTEAAMNGKTNMGPN